MCTCQATYYLLIYTLFSSLFSFLSFFFVIYVILLFGWLTERKRAGFVLSKVMSIPFYVSVYI